MTESNSIKAAEAAELNRMALRSARVVGVTVVGSAGAGKTTLLEATLRRLHERFRAGVVIANPTADRDARRLTARCRAVAAVPVAAMDAARLHEVLSGMNLHDLDLLFIESIVRLGGAGRIDLGENTRVAVFSVAGGDDKAAEFPRTVADADLVLLNKLDLLPHVRFDTRVFENDVRRLNIDAPVLHVSATDGTGMDRWERWLREQLRRARRGPSSDRFEAPEVFLG